jgi:predicted regulator of Ras-like GTPase activity (Roadblock/LC7/MglB family)
LPYRKILERLLTGVPGSRTALLLDGQGEVVVGAGDLDERHRLIGAYQGIALGMVSRTAGRFDLGSVGSLVWRHKGGTVILTTLRDGYYLVLSVGPRTLVAAAQRQCETTGERLDEEI